MSRLLLLTLLVSAVSAQQAPRIGVVRDDSGRLQRVVGLAGSFVVQNDDLHVLAAASSGREAILKTAEELIITDGDGRRLTALSAPPGPANFAFAKDGSAALVWFASTRELCRLPSGRPLPWQPSGEVVAIGWPNRAIVRREDRLWLLDGAIEVPLQGLEAPAALLADGRIVASRGASVVVIGLDGGEREIFLEANPSRLEVMGEQWIAIAAGDHSYALRLSSEPTVYLLPRSAQ
ncbi:MAG: hypothetical protein SFV54_15810 [Bryobacteraceae bacterium]|nr:hypothetical protein [Bryobacteraceae bacterium]